MTITQDASDVNDANDGADGHDDKDDDEDGDGLILVDDAVIMVCCACCHQFQYHRLFGIVFFPEGAF